LLSFASVHKILICFASGATSFEDLRSLNGQVYDTFKEVCRARGLLEDDREWLLCLQEAAHVEACRGIARGTLHSPVLSGLLASKQVVVGVYEMIY
jgi:hypothetical protein